MVGMINIGSKTFWIGVIALLTAVVEFWFTGNVNALQVFIGAGLIALRHTLQKALE